MNETEKEQHALAASAAGYTGVCYEDGHHWIDGPLTQAGIYPVRWSPRHDDGDAFRLMVALGIRIDPRDPETRAFGSVGEMVAEYHKPNAYAATREAIFRVAVETGRAMK